MRECLYCGKENTNEINKWCPTCSAKLRKVGLWDYIDTYGYRDTETGLIVTHENYRSLSEVKSDYHTDTNTP